MRDGMSKRYLQELEQVLEAEAELARQGTDLLADPEYRAIRERFIDGDISLAEFAGRVDALSASRPEDGEAEGGAAGGNADGQDPEADDDEDDWDDIDDDPPFPGADRLS